MQITEPTASTAPKVRASSGLILPLGTGRAAVRAMRASISASYHMFNAPAAPAPTAMHASAAIASTGCMWPGAATRPTSAVNAARSITRGFISAKYSATSPPSVAARTSGLASRLSFGHASLTCERRRPRAGLRSRPCQLALRFRRLHHLIRGSVYNCGRAAATAASIRALSRPLPQGLAGACTFRAKAWAMPNRNTRKPAKAMYDPIDETMFQPANASG